MARARHHCQHHYHRHYHHRGVALDPSEGPCPGGARHLVELPPVGRGRRPSRKASRLKTLRWQHPGKWVRKPRKIGSGTARALAAELGAAPALERLDLGVLAPGPGGLQVDFAAIRGALRHVAVASEEHESFEQMWDAVPAGWPKEERARLPWARGITKQKVPRRGREVRQCIRSASSSLFPR
jgi:hypothetical protein